MTRSEPRWLGRLVVDEAHFRLIRDHGGSHGLRDENALESAIARPQQRWRYEPDPPFSELAAACGYGLARNDAYIDGNKRVALVVMVAFLDRNGIELTATNREALAIMVAVAAGDASEAELAAWIEAHAAEQPG
jgi:death on curing protein